jgi:homoserine dehydrogenase
MAGASITSIEGILNGTTNCILSEMEHSAMGYEDALREAQRLGIAETDPSLDVEGWDTASKLLIITNVLMDAGMGLEDISVEGITGITPEMVRNASEQGMRYKLLGRAELKDGRIEASVRLERLSESHPLYGVCGRDKAVRYVSDTLGELTLMGGASGTVPAAASIMRDLINLHRGCSLQQMHCYKFL